jgi:Xaa-Pro aminopeptidase
MSRTGTGSYLARSDCLVTALNERSLDLLLVTNLTNVRYLSGFSGTNAACLIGPHERILLTDFRYVERAKAEAPDYELVQGKRDLLGNVAELAGERACPNGLRLGFDDANLTVSQHTKLAGLVSDEVELVAAGGLVEQLRAVKDETELTAVRKAAEIADDLYRWLIEEHGLAGHSELSVARALERRAQDMGAEGASFPPIVAAAENGALPHAVPRDVAIPEGVLVVVDLGCRFDGYCSDCTRTLATGTIGGEAREAYELVRSAQAAAAGVVRAGVGASAVDSAARGEIERAGRADQFGHPTGHGVGLEVHEEPRLAPDVDAALVAGNVVTVEPGLYVPERFGVRIEDLVVVRPDGSEVLSSIPRDLIAVG